MLHVRIYSPGSTVGQATVEESLSYIATCVNRAHIATKSITIVLENMVSLLVKPIGANAAPKLETG